MWCVTEAGGDTAVTDQDDRATKLRLKLAHVFALINVSVCKQQA